MQPRDISRSLKRAKVKSDNISLQKPLHEQLKREKRNFKNISRRLRLANCAINLSFALQEHFVVNPLLHRFYFILRSSL